MLVLIRFLLSLSVFIDLLRGFPFSLIGHGHVAGGRRASSRNGDMSVSNYDSRRNLEKAKESIATGLEKTKQMIDDDEDNSLKGSAVGAVVGGAVLGPLGAVLGASVGGDIARSGRSSGDRSRSRGDSLQQICTYLQEECKQAKDTLAYITAQRDDEKKRAVKLHKEAIGLYDLAREVVTNQEDDEAGKKFLKQRNEVQEKCKNAMKNVSELELKMKSQEANILKLEGKLSEALDVLGRETQAQQSLTNTELDESSTSPLMIDSVERRFRELEKDSN